MGIYGSNSSILPIAQTQLYTFAFAYVDEKSSTRDSFPPSTRFVNIMNLECRRGISRSRRERVK